MKFKLLEIFTFLTGLLIILFIIWNRFLRVRLPKYIVADSSLCNILGVTCLVLCFLFLFLYSLYKLLPRKKIQDSWINKVINSISTKETLNKILSFFIHRIVQAPLYVYNEIYKRVFMRPLLEWVGSHLSAKLNNYKEIFYFIVFVIPKVIVSICFIIDIIVFKEFFYFYNSLILLIIPLFVNIILFVIQDHATKQRDNIEYSFIFEEFEGKIYISLQPNLTKDEREFAITANLEAVYNLRRIYTFIDNFVNEITEIKKFYNHKVNVVYYGMYFIGFLFYGLILLNIY